MKNLWSYKSQTFERINRFYQQAREIGWFSELWEQFSGMIVTRDCDSRTLSPVGWVNGGMVRWYMSHFDSFFDWQVSFHSSLVEDETRQKQFSIPATCYKDHFDRFTWAACFNFVTARNAQQTLLADILEWRECKGVRFKRKPIFSCAHHPCVAQINLENYFKSGQTISRPNRRPSPFFKCGLVRENCRMALGLVNDYSSDSTTPYCLWPPIQRLTWVGMLFVRLRSGFNVWLHRWLWSASIANW